MNKVTIKGLPYGDVEVDTDDILCNDIIFPGEFNPNKVGLYVVEIGGSYSPYFKALWGPDHEILDIAVDANMLDNLQLEEEYSENFARLGNASEPFNLDNVGLNRVDLAKQDQSFMMLLAEARGANVDKLSDL
jgi:hypothetical protein